MHVALIDLNWGGHHTPYVVFLSRYFIGKGHQVTFVTHEDNPRLDELPDAEDLEIRARDFSTYPDSPERILTSIREQYIRFKQLQEIYRVAQEAEVDIVHLLYFDRTQVPFWITSKIALEELPPTIATLHRDAFLDSSERSILQAATQTITKFALHSSLKSKALDCLTVHANSIRDRIIGGVPAATRANTRMVPAPTPDYSVEADPATLREELDLPENRPLLLFFGGLREEKGPDLIADLLTDVDRTLAVVYAGSPVDFDATDVERWRQQVEPSVNILDRLEFIPEDDVTSYFAAADALVLPYRRNRGISGPLRRAAVVGTPAIGAARTDVGDVIEQWDLGATFDRNDRASFSSAVDSVLAMDDTEGMASFAASRDWQKSGRQFETAYAKVINL